MPAPTRTFYEVLGVKRGATAAEIDRAYARVRAQLGQEESDSVDPRRAAIVKAAYTTLSDAEARAQYDDGLKRKPIRVIDMLGLGAAALMLAGLGWWIHAWQSNRAAAADADEGVDVARLVGDMAARISPVEAALVSGELRALGSAVETGEREMTAACPDLPPGTALNIRTAKSTLLHAEIMRSGGSGLCTLAVAGAQGGVKVRPDVPQSTETLQALVPAGDTFTAAAVRIARVATTAAGAVFVLKASGPLPNGTPVFDLRERLVGIVVAPQDLVPGAQIAVAPATPGVSPQR